MAGEIGRVVKKFREQAHLRQADLSKACGVKQPNLSRIEKGHCEPRHATLSRIAEALGTTVEVIETEAARIASLSWPPQRQPMTLSGAAPVGLKTMVIPVFDTSAGYAVDFDDGGHPVGVSDMTVEVPLVDVPCFACRVYGDSMVGNGRDSFPNGDIVIFAQRQPRNGDYAFVRTRELSSFKQIYFEPHGVRLVPLNRAYEEKVLPTKELLQAWKLVQHVRMFE
jgi:phage repressor protein C with HTH and peptisase S24 domain